MLILSNYALLALLKRICRYCDFVECRNVLQHVFNNLAMEHVTCRKYYVEQLCSSSSMNTIIDVNIVFQ